MFDLHALVNANFDHTNITGATIENLTADPEIEIRSDYMTAPVARNSNGNIVFTREDEADALELGENRMVIYFIDGFIYYESLVKTDDATIKAIKDEMRSVLNVNNVSPSRAWGFYMKPSTYNNVPHIGRIDFTIRAIQTDVGAET